MSKMFYFNPRTKEVNDIVVKKRDAGGGAMVMAGEERIGLLFGDSVNGWCAVSFLHPCWGPRKVDGFKARWNAIEHLLNIGPRYRDGAHHG